MINSKSLRKISFSATIFIYLTIILGGYVRSIGAGLACGDDWPTCKGQLIPSDLLNPFVLLEYTHRIVALLSSIFVITIAIIVLLHYKKERPLVKWSVLTAILMIVQILIGMIVVILRLNPSISAIHLTIATATFGSSIVTTIISLKLEEYEAKTNVK